MTKLQICCILDCTAPATKVTVGPRGMPDEYYDSCEKHVAELSFEGGTVHNITPDGAYEESPCKVTTPNV